MESDEVELFKRRQRRGRLAWGASVLALVGAAGLAFVTLQPSPCEQLAAEVCESVGGDCAQELGAGLNDNVSQDTCAETLETMRAAVSVAPEQESMIRAIALRQLVTDELGQDPLSGKNAPDVTPTQAR